MPPRSISLLRHAEKQIADQPPPYGITTDGHADPESLTPRGWQRAGAIVGLFVPRPGGSVDGLLATPTHLFAWEVGPHSQSRRPIEILQPLADRLGLPIRSHISKTTSMG